MLRRIGAGGMGVVYEAFDRKRKQSVAAKTLLNVTPASLYRFKREFRTLADVGHPNLVSLHELIVTSNEQPFFTMELISGTDFLKYVRPYAQRDSQSLRSGASTMRAPRRFEESSISHEQLRARSRPEPSQPQFDLDRLRAALQQLVEGLEVLHCAGKVHRDIKPANVLVTPEGRVVVLDFGIATELSDIVGKPIAALEEPVAGTASYMSPEQGQGEHLSLASDWYSVGIVLYEALVGRLPFNGSLADVLAMKRLGLPVAPSEYVAGVPEDLDSLCCALLQRDPKKRPIGAEILEKLRAARPVYQVLSPPPVDWGRVIPLIGREPELDVLQQAFSQSAAGACITVRVTGASGMGKTALAEHFLDLLADRGDAIVMRGRAHERETIPFKAFDGVVDALSGYLMRLEGEGKLPVLPDSVGALARVFPVLRRLCCIEKVVVADSDPQVVRRKAFTALRALFAVLATRIPLVIYIDDVQWGDADSAALYLELVRHPPIERVLFVLTNREEEARTSLFLEETRDRWQLAADTRQIVLGPLTLRDSERLAIALSETTTGWSRRTALAVASESQGNPFILEELVRANMSIGARSEMDALAFLTLEEVVLQRSARLPDDARLVTEIVAVGGCPLPLPLIALATGIDRLLDKAIAHARSRRFLRTGQRDGVEVVEARHERIRETIVASLPAERLREHHRRLAQSFEANSELYAEPAAMHYLAAGENTRAAQHAERAAEHAIAKLAFEQAERLLRLTLAITQGAPNEQRRLRCRLAEVITWSGRSREAARIYLAAAEGAPLLSRTKLEREASLELFFSGRIVEGADVLRRVLTTLGMVAPRRTIAVLFSLLAYRLWLTFLAFLGLPLVWRAPESVSVVQHARIDAMLAASIGFAFSDVLLGASMAARHAVLCINCGDRFEVMRGALLEASQHAALGGCQGKVERVLVRLAARLHAESSNEFEEGFYRGAQGVSSYLRGEWKKALELLDAAIQGNRVMRDHSAGWTSLAAVFACWALNLLGRHGELARRHNSLIDQAEQHSDTFMSVQLRDGSLAVVWLAADEPQAARRHTQESLVLWPHDKYLLQHWHRLYGEAEIDLYLGHGDNAYARVRSEEPAVRRSLLLMVQHVRVQNTFLRGRCAIASLESVAPNVRTKRIKEIGRLARKLERERMAWSAPFAAILRAAVANAVGNIQRTTMELRSAVSLARKADMLGYARAAEYQLGTVVGGDEGQALRAQAECAIRDQEIRMPARFAAMLVPGQWGASRSQPI